MGKFQPCQSAMIAALLSAASALAVAQDSGVRIWTDVQNRTLQASYLAIKGDSVVLKKVDGSVVQVPLTRLCPDDLNFIGLQGKQSTSAPAAITETSRTPIEKRTWPVVIGAPGDAVEIKLVSENPAERKYIYRSQSFEFSSQAKIAGSVMKEVARTFEATRLLVQGLPWGVQCQPPPGLERFQAALYESRSDYIAAGGPPNSGGVYSTGDKVFRIPFESLGLVKRGQTYFKQDFTSNTLVHEITHQMMDNYLMFLPLWVAEGCAEYTQMLPYNAGTFRAEAHKNAIKEAIASWRSDAQFDGLERHMTMTREQWQAEALSSGGSMARLYHRSQLLIYYFCHLDGDRKGTRFMEYMEAVYGQVAEMRAFFADPRVKQLGGGRFSYPEDMKLPDMNSDSAALKNLATLVGGRSYQQLAAEIVEGYRTIGVRVEVSK